MDEDDKDAMTVSLKVDQKAQVGILTDVKQELREAMALKISYTSLNGDPLKNLKK